MKLQNYIICHDQASYDYHQDHRFMYILAGYKEIRKDNKMLITLRDLPDNIEQHKSLLTFTAWYALVKNNLIKSDYIGLFEYDVDFKEDVFENNRLNKYRINGFLQRDLPDPMFLDCIAYFKQFLTPSELEICPAYGYWLPTTNFILPRKFLIDFVNWYERFIPGIFNATNHPHFHERAVNIFAMNEGYLLDYSNKLTHKQLCSHGINFDS